MNKFLQTAIGIFMTFIFGLGLAMAELPAVVGTTLTSIQTDGLALVALVWPVVGALVSIFVLIKLFKRGMSKI